MNKQLHTLAAAFLLAVSSQLHAQALTEKTDIRFYEHHSTDMTKSPFGFGANGSQSGYDFVKQDYYNSFKASTSGPYTNGEEANIDMVEHAGPFGSGSNYLGFTSGVSTIWEGDIKGNGTTLWMKAPASFNYDAAADASAISQAFNTTMAGMAIGEVRTGDVFIGRIRGGNQYVAIKCTASKPVTISNSGENDNVYFDFSYKTNATSTGLDELSSSQFLIYPNPAATQLQLDLRTGGKIASLRLFDLTGKEVMDAALHEGTADISTLANGLYTLQIVTGSGETATRKFIKQN